jgi:hypothetical protein
MCVQLFCAFASACKRVQMQKAEKAATWTSQVAISKKLFILELKKGQKVRRAQKV